MSLGKGSGGGSSTQTVTQKLSPEQQALLKLALPVAEEFVNNPPTLYPDPTVQPFTQAQLDAQAAGVDAAGSIGELANRTQAAQNFLFTDAIDPANNPYLQAAIEAAVRPINESLTEQILPNIRGEAGVIGGFGGSRQGIAEGLAGKAALQEIGDTSGQIAFDAYGAGLDALTKGLFASKDIANLTLQPASILDLIGRQQQSQQEREIAELTQRFMTEQNLPFAAAQAVAGLAFGIPAGTTTATTDQGGGETGPLQGMIGGAATGAAIGSVFPVIGTGIGALVGGAAGLFGSFN